MSAPVVLIHGLFQMLDGLDAEKQLAPRPVLIPDLPGYGRNREAVEVSLPAAVDYVHSTILAAGFSGAHVVGHSIGGAVAVLLARRYPEVVRSVINVEGNFTLKDAFWSRRIAEMSASDAESLLDAVRTDPAGWLSRAGIDPTAERIALATLGLNAQPPSTVQRMARSVVAITAEPAYLEDVRVVLDRGVPFHLFAGERSLAGWDVPAFVAERARSMTVQPGVGHMMMLENALEFFRLVAGLLPPE